LGPFKPPPAPNFSSLTAANLRRKITAKAAEAGAALRS
jgi:hypothetical protein